MDFKGNYKPIQNPQNKIVEILLLLLKWGGWE